MYRYDAADGSVMCVSCGKGDCSRGRRNVMSREDPRQSLITTDETPPLTQMSENGQEVFFQTTAQLVPQDTNSTR